MEDKRSMSRRQYMKTYRKTSFLGEIVGSFTRNKLAVLGFFVFLVILIGALAAESIMSYQQVISINPVERLQGPSAQHFFGTDEMGQDIFGRILHGARISLRIGVTSVLLSLIAGAILGSVAGYFGGRVDMVVMRIMDVFICLPNFLLAVAIVAAFGTSETNMLIAISISQVPACARIVRSAILSVRDQEYVEAARALGVRVPSIILKDILMNCFGPIIVHCTLQVAFAITTIATLSFLGLGIAAPAPEWGCMLSSARTYMREYPHLVIFPGMAIFFTVFSFNLLGDGLRDALDPRLRQ